MTDFCYSKPINRYKSIFKSDSRLDEFIKNLEDIKNIRNNTANGGYTIKKYQITKMHKAIFSGRRNFIENMIILGTKIIKHKSRIIIKEDLA